MIGLDTNVLVRYIAQDDPLQSQKATALFETLSADEPGYVTLVALVETAWVLAGRYGADRAKIAEVVETLLKSREIRVEQSDVAWQALRLFSTSSADFADCLVERGGQAARCRYTVTFDVRAAKTSGMHLID